jgi:hypothetical protein
MRPPRKLYGHSILETAMLDYLDERSKDPTPFVWTADAELILGKVRRLSEPISDSGHNYPRKETT